MADVRAGLKLATPAEPPIPVARSIAKSKVRRLVINSEAPFSLRGSSGRAHELDRQLRELDQFDQFQLRDIAPRLQVVDLLAEFFLRGGAR